MQDCLFDSHCHLDDVQFDLDRQALLQSWQRQGGLRLLCAASDLSSSRACLALASQWDFVAAACGVHPHEAAKAPDDYLVRLEQLLQAPQAAAVGEIGLDYHYDFCPRPRQIQVLEQQLDLAWRLHKPAILHVREAHGDMLDILRARQRRFGGGVLHCYSGSLESAHAYLELGCYISFAGTVTFKNAEKLRAVLRALPLDRILIETDSPYLAPIPYRGGRNQPDFVQYVCQTVAEQKGISYRQAMAATCQNAVAAFRLPP